MNVQRRSFLVGGALLLGGRLERVFAADAGPVAETTAGKVRGYTIGPVNAFRGVPYGASTTGSNRFMPPARRAPWTGVRDTLEIGLRAPQLPVNLVAEMGVMDRTEPMGEDCLCLNVWTQGLNDNRKRPVMVWLHGGGLASGSAGFLQYDGANLAAKHDVVVVGVNHRLNVFGFLYLAELGGTQFSRASNVGMLDIVAALEWVRDNIGNFGGDPGNVTIFGQSGGGTKVSTLLGMPAAKGLFHRAIAMSGSAVAGQTPADATNSAGQIMKSLNVTQVADLQKLPFRTVLDMTRGPVRLGAVTDGKTLPAIPFDPVATPISADVPLLIGSTETEVTWTVTQQYDPLDDNELRDAIKRTLRSNDDTVARLIGMYKKDRPKASNLDLYLIAATDASNFRTGTDLEADRKAALNKAPVYKYYFQWYSPVRGGMLRAMHTMDIPFVFENVDIARTQVGEGKERYALADRMSTAWVNFARAGNPNHKDLPEWPAFNATQRPTMIFNNECRVANNPWQPVKDAVGAAQGRG
jgi:para-nitrobenzyl esterase